MKTRRLLPLLGALILLVVGPSILSSNATAGHPWRDPATGVYLAICDEEANAVALSTDGSPRGSVHVAGTGEIALESTGQNEGTVTITQRWVVGEREGKFYDIPPGEIRGTYSHDGRYGTMMLDFGPLGVRVANFTIMKVGSRMAQQLFLAIPCTFPFTHEDGTTTYENVLVRLTATRIGLRDSD